MIQIDTTNYNQEEIITDLKQNTIEKVLEKHQLTWQELIYIQTQKNLKQNPKTTNILHTKKNTYKVNKIIDNKLTNYGEYNSKKEAETIVEELKKHYWNKNELENIKKTHNIKDIKEMIQ